MKYPQKLQQLFLKKKRLKWMATGWAFKKKTFTKKSSKLKKSW